MPNISFWEQNSIYKDADVAIIGSGLVGLMTAWHLLESNKDVDILIVERGQIPQGASTRNAGFACFGSISEILDDLENTETAKVEEIIRMRYQGLQKLKSIVPPDQMTYERRGGFELFLDQDEASYNKCKMKLEYMNAMMKRVIGLDNTYQLVSGADAGVQSKHGLIFNQYEAELDPGRLVNYLIVKLQQSGVRFLFNAEVDEFNCKEKIRIRLKNGINISANKLVLATNAFKHFNQILKEDIRPVRNQVYVTYPIDQLPIRGCYHCDKGFVYFRNVANRILIGGGRNQFVEENNTSEFNVTKSVETYLKEFLYTYVVANKTLITFEYKWSGIIAIGQTKGPIVKWVSENTVLAARLGGMGVAVSALVGEKAAHLTLS